MFSLDRLKVYDKALARAASLAWHSRSWDKRHAVTDQLLRASESFVLNLSRGCAVAECGQEAASARCRAAWARVIDPGLPDDDAMKWAMKWAMKCEIKWD